MAQHNRSSNGPQPNARLATHLRLPGAEARIDRSVRFAMCGHADHEEGAEGDNYAPAELDECAEALRKFPRYEV